MKTQALCDDSEKSEDERKRDMEQGNNILLLDPDHRLLLKQTKPLLQSCNAAVSQFFFFFFQLYILMKHK